MPICLRLGTLFNKGAGFRVLNGGGADLRVKAMGSGASVARSPAALAAELERLRQRELNTKVRYNAIVA